VIALVFVLNIQYSEPVLSGQFVSGTEYNVDEEGQVIVEIRDKDGVAVQTNCTVNVWYPNKTLWISQVASVSDTGNSWINFTTPYLTGVYEYQANCTAKGKVMVMSKSFHVSTFQNDTLTKLNRIKAVTPK
jgi:hypothetical protein